MLSKELERIIGGAVQEVKMRQHEFLTLEHLLYSYTIDAHGQSLLRGCGVDVERLRLRTGGCRWTLGGTTVRSG